jgi:hypothetical protein
MARNEAQLDDLGNHQMEPLWSEPEAAKFLTLSYRTLQKYRENGTGPDYIKMNHRIAYRPEAIRRWLMQRELTSTSQMRKAS